jgi:DHA3 family macrolide efflux protein-like MFS transporter
MLLAPMASAALLSVSTIERIFFIDVGTALIAVLALLLFLQVAPRENTEESQATGYFADLRNGLRYIANHGYLKRFFLFVALFVFLAAPASFLTPLQVVRSFGGGEWRLMAIEIAFSVGMMAGGGILAAWGGFRNRIHTMTAACLLFGLMTLLFGVLPNFWLYLAAMAVAGLSMPLFNTPATVLLQEKVRGDYLGRVFGVMGMIGSSVMPMAMLLFGPIADAVEIEWLLIATGVMLLALSFMLIGSRNLVEAGKARTAP